MRFVHCIVSTLLITSGIAFSSYPVLAEDVVTHSHFALLVGNTNYENKDVLPVLVNPCNDVTAVAGKLQLIGWDENDIDWQCDLKKDVLASKIDKFIQRFQNESDPTAILYFAGHGVQVADQKYLFGVDANPDLARVASVYARSPDATLFKSDAVDINTALTDIGSNFNGALLVVIDACRDNPLIERLNAIFTTNMPAQQSIRSLISNPKSANKDTAGVVILYSTKAGAVADDGIGANSPFADAFAHQIRSKVPIDRVISETGTKVFKSTKDTPREQHPDRESWFFEPPDRCFIGCEDEAATGPETHGSLQFELGTNLP